MLVDYVVQYWQLLALLVALVSAIAETRTKLHFLQRRIDQTDEDIKLLQSTIKEDIKDISNKIDRNHEIVIEHLLRGHK